MKTRAVLLAHVAKRLFAGLLAAPTGLRVSAAGAGAQITFQNYYKVVAVKKKLYGSSGKMKSVKVKK